MSEYQYYEFLAIDRPLKAEELEYVRSLSSRANPTPSQVVFTYSYGDFRGEPLGLLGKYYDVMVYLANWGSRQLAFRFPPLAIDIEALQPYYYGVDEIELSTTEEQYIILNIAFHEEETGYWIEGEGLLTAMAPLRDNILRGDLRALYLAWLKSATYNARGLDADDDDESDEEDDRDEEDDTSQYVPVIPANKLIEPPIPPGLGQLTAPLQAFVEFFDIDEDLIAAAAAASPPLKAVDEPVAEWVSLLPEAERQAFLVRVARGEPVGAELLRRLREIGGKTSSTPAATPQRTFATIRAEAEKLQQKRTERERQETEQARLGKLNGIAKRESELWAQVPKLIDQKTSTGYKDAVAILSDLRDLAVHRGQTEQFNERIAAIRSQYSTRSALLRQLREAKLIS